jgi:hypothetical protein
MHMVTLVTMMILVVMIFPLHMRILMAMIFS